MFSVHWTIVLSTTLSEHDTEQAVTTQYRQLQQRRKKLVFPERRRDRGEEKY